MFEISAIEFIHLLFKHGRYDRFQPYPDGHLPSPRFGDLGGELGDSITFNNNGFLEKYQGRQVVSQTARSGVGRPSLDSA